MARALQVLLRRVLLSAVLASVFPGLVRSAVGHDGIVWDGPPMTFIKGNDTDEKLEANQDRITGLVWLTRAYRQGLFNIAAEEAHNTAAPAGTEWAYGTTADIDSLTFTTWEELHGGRDGGGPRNLLNKDTVLHLIEENIYMDVKLTSWTRNGGGGFAYIRSTEPEGGGIVLSAETREAALGGGEDTVGVTASGGYEYTVSTDESWIAIVSEPRVTGSSTVAYRVDPNATSIERTGIIRIGEESLSVTQPGMTSTLEILTGGDVNLGTDGGSGQVEVISQDPFTVATPSWIEVSQEGATSLAGSSLQNAVLLPENTPNTVSGDQGVTSFSWSVANAAPLENRSGSIDMVDVGGHVLGSIEISQTGGDGVGAINLSARAQVGTGQNILIPGLVVGGAGKTRVLVRGVGPTLEGFGVAGVLPDPQIQLFRGGGDPVGQNTSWRDDETTLQKLFDELGAFGLTSARDSAALFELDSGAYTIQLKDESDATGVGLVEIYVVDGSVNRGLVNLSARAEVGSGGRVMIPGVVVQGNQSIEVLFRGVGPSLESLGVADALEDPEIEVFDSEGRSIASNDDWDANLSTVFSQVGAFPLDPDSKDAAILLTLPPGDYTAHIRGKGDAIGVALLEVYFLVNY